ncbi:MAG TPA: NAD(P)H-dependent oxidoreductase [Chloroflexota bacterium]|nr:NAD(P)H-dependent oxidoreductase [Chloroflexota bacterium]
MKPKVLVLLGSTRRGRVGETVARWLMGQLHERREADFELVDLREYRLPVEDGPSPEQDDGVARRWMAKVGAADAFIIVTPEYNHGYPAALKCALDCAYEEWNRKPVAFVSYGGHGAGYRAVEQLRQVAIELQMVPIREQVGIQYPWAAFDAHSRLVRDGAEQAVRRMVDDLLWWARVLQPARASGLPA